ncbi:MAG: KTSC domain-containing protein [Chitinophagaceae bacterium]|nr:KTSC domain-containing protein [Chitinophagaceae bacterium]
MKRIERHRAILGVDDKATLSDLKKVYRKIMMEWHPDKFQESDDAKKMAEEKSAKLIASYHFLVSVHTETREATLAEYTATTTEASIDDFEYKSEILRVVFSDGHEYEYYGVPKAIYVKLVNADTPDRFARRHIYENYLYRSTSKIVGGNE